MYRQGDVLIIPVSPAECPHITGLIPNTPRGVVLAEGEATGHAHVLDHGELYHTEDSMLRVLNLQGPANLLHEEHAPVQLPKGLYLVRRQREYTPEENRQVAD